MAKVNAVDGSLENDCFSLAAVLIAVDKTAAWPIADDYTIAIEPSTAANPQQLPR